MKQVLFLILFALAAFQAVAQKQVSVSVNTVNDDLEEWTDGPGQTKTVGTLDGGSSDIELGYENGANDPQIAGLRFTGISIPKGAYITRAYIQFTVDNTNKNLDPANLWITAQAADNPVTFDPAANFNISSRPRLNDSILWNIPAGSWNMVGAKGANERTPDISALVQALVDRAGWADGNAMVFIIGGTGTREAESYDGSPNDAPKLVIEYLPVQSLTSQVSTPEDDQEEWIAGPGQTKTPGTLDAGSSDLELGYENGASDPQIVGVRFTNLQIPQGSYIKSAYLQFQVDNTNKNADPVNLWIKAQNSAAPAAFDVANPFNITSRPTLPDSIFWKIADNTWKTVGEAGADQRSTNIAQLVQALVNRADWQTGGAMVFTIGGTGTREAESYDGLPAGAPKLFVEFVPTATVTAAPKAPEDDQEEWIAGPGQTKTPGTLDAGSSDLELGYENGASDPQIVGIRFPDVQLPQGAIVTKAYIQFQVDNTNKNADPVNLWIKAQDADNPAAFDAAALFNITSRPTLKDSITWNIPANTWKTVGEAGPDQRSANIAQLVQALVNRPGWASGNAMVFTIGGTGTREAESYDGLPAGAPKLVIEYLTSGGGNPGQPITTFPINKLDSWAYLDGGQQAPADWNTAAFDDSAWKFAKGGFGYGTSDVATTVSFGGNPNNKAITTYFRKRISIADVTTLPNSLELQMRADDGAVVYINGAEALRFNMPAGTVTNATTSSFVLRGNRELVYFTYDIPRSLLQNGVNVVAVEVHQSGNATPDGFFDLALRLPVGPTNATNLGCTGPNDTHIGCFTSLVPRPQRDTAEVPGSHAFQYVIFENDAYTLGGGSLPGIFDFTGYVPINGSSRDGYLSINHELSGLSGAVSMLDLGFNYAKGLWTVETSGRVDFSPVVATERNCSGTVTPWGTIITSEESLNNTDSNNDGYLDIGWNVEIIPATRQVRDYGNGKEKLWAMGRMSHENVVILADRKTAYQGEDDPFGAVYKFVADQPENLSSGKLYALKLDQPLVGGEPSGTTATWVLVPNTTKAERNAVKAFADANATTFNGVEDVEVNPLTGEIYFAVKGSGRVYSFKDNGNTISNFKTFVGGQSYRVTINNEVVTEDWNFGNDNLTFDERGNLWVLQDGGRNHVWIVRPDHTQASPKVEVFMHIPIGAEPTGMTFTPDFRYMFMSIQDPSSSNSTQQTDISGKTSPLNRSVALSIARREYLGKEQMVAVNEPGGILHTLRLYPNPTSGIATLELDLETAANARVEVIDATGRVVSVSADASFGAGLQLVPVKVEIPGVYFVRITLNGNVRTVKLVKE